MGRGIVPRMTNPERTRGTAAPTPSASPATLYTAGPSYYSAIARLALVEAGVPFTKVKIDIHLRAQQLEPRYARINPGMTVPALVAGDRVLTQSRDIVGFALGPESPEATRWLDRHYGYPIEDLTFGKMLAGSALARRAVPGRLEKNERRLLALADANPDLAGRYRERAAVFAERRRTFAPEAVARLYEQRRGEALALLDALDAELADGRASLLPRAYGHADVVWTVFVARMGFVGLRAEVTRRLALARWYAAMTARPSFRAADVWERFSLVKMVKQLV